MADQSPLRVVADANAKITTPVEENQAKQQETVAEAPSSNSAPAAAVAAPGGNKVRRRRSLTRPILFALLPVALVVGGYYYVNGGQVMSTDNAYIQADMVGLTTDVSGIVDQINVHENEAVKAGQVLFRLRSDSFKIALDGAKAQLGAQRNQIMNLKASYQQSLAEITQAQADLPYYQDQFDRQQNLVNNGSATQSAYDEAKHNLEAAQQKVAVAKAEAATTLAQLGGNADQPVEENPLYLQAKSQVDNAQRELDHSVVKAPFDGIVTNVNALQVGSYLEASQQAFSLVGTNHLWIAASPKETELTYVKPGQTADISVDTYPGVVWKGKVESISPASGSSFSLLPAQNTTGNWVKVVQRIPMRVSIEDTDGKPPLRVGMSTVVDVETGHVRGLPDFVNTLLGRPQGKGHE
ncbi:HlyD family secretion protein [Rhizobium ruizarguesonis]|jgi:membrane fusion protein (multidrug efflux system)|uniref:HlyD family secretion protein n=1 Tax=Rhizobium ruizarguesonis TaxID=2081791 RepID=A0AB38I742_9HYPH|nr:HlyD family secretion protein [Rhizobium ruizarguesonis]NEI08379.1 HlyD family efflux transporter periplasmic adaptor subunit [Rhizobium ruizarguesonis]NEI30353.1 HlyD family efflux transporter periplasmic adaptor subunit [Rhizobium ruizarguesonis]TAT85194.1 HlyD family secretion protein [Rhizobium ruizarguesonis]TAU32814.1 HlyD family secretion protein [Rhizobium ruizarguesonis]TAW22976.1 HlyD family secretion protein [Rhizobium ruizarguesonis]